MPSHETHWIKWISEIQAIAQNGLTFSNNEFDKERYMKLMGISAEIAAHYSTTSQNRIHKMFAQETGYATPKLDVRAFILKDNKLLLAKERSDGLWTLPGGWADINESPSAAVIRETKEETGYDVSALKLLALWDKLKHDHPPQWPHAYKCFFHCKIISGTPTINIEISELDFFDINNLPPLSTHRVTAKQLVRLYDLVHKPESTQFD